MRRFAYVTLVNTLKEINQKIIITSKVILARKIFNSNKFFFIALVSVHVLHMALSMTKWSSLWHHHLPCTLIRSWMAVPPITWADWKSTMLGEILGMWECILLPEMWNHSNQWTWSCRKLFKMNKDDVKYGSQ